MPGGEIIWGNVIGGLMIGEMFGTGLIEGTGTGITVELSETLFDSGDVEIGSFSNRSK